MNISFLGAHNIESCDTGFTCLLIDDALAIDAGGLTASLSFKAQRELKAVLLTHRHYDHLRDIPSIAMNCYLSGTTINLYAIPDVYDEMTTHLFDGKLYPNFLERPLGNPTIHFTVVEPCRTEQIAGYCVLPVPVTHAVPAIGYQITSPDGKTVFCTGDTGPGLAECWQQVSPQLLIVEVTLPDEQEELALTAGHLTPALLKQEMTAFQELKGHLPQIVTVHMNPELEEEIETQLGDVAEALNHPITLGYEGMQLQL